MTQSNFTIREAQPADAEKILAYAKAVFTESRFTLTEADEFQKSTPEQAAWIQEHLNHPGRAMFVAVSDEGEIIGMIDFRNGHRRRIFHHGEFGMSVIAPWRKKGVGRAMLDRLIAWAKESPLIEKINLKVHADNEIAIRMYESYGFKEEGRQIKDLKLGPGKYVDGVLMGLFIK